MPGDSVIAQGAQEEQRGKENTAHSCSHLCSQFTFFPNPGFLSASPMSLGTSLAAAAHTGHSFPEHIFSYLNGLSE